MVIFLVQGANVHMAQLMPLPLIVSCFTKIQIGFTFLVPVPLGSPRKRAVKQVCACVCGLLLCITHTLVCLPLCWVYWWALQTTTKLTGSQLVQPLLQLILSASPETDALRCFSLGPTPPKMPRPVCVRACVCADWPLDWEHAALQ